MLRRRGPEGGARTSAGPCGFWRAHKPPFVLRHRGRRGLGRLQLSPLGLTGSTLLPACTSLGPRAPPLWASERRTSRLPDFPGGGRGWWGRRRRRWPPRDSGCHIPTQPPGSITSVPPCPTIPPPQPTSTPQFPPHIHPQTSSATGTALSLSCSPKAKGARRRGRDKGGQLSGHI